MAVDRVGVTQRRRSRQGGVSMAGPARSLIPLIRLAWLAAILCAAPQFFLFSLREVDNQVNGAKAVDCWAGFYGSEAFEKAYVIAFLFIIFFLPFLVITASYCVVTHRIWSYTRRASESNSQSPAVESRNEHVVLNAVNSQSHNTTKSIGDEDDDEQGCNELATMDTQLYEMKALATPSMGSNRKLKTTCGNGDVSPNSDQPQQQQQQHLNEDAQQQQQQQQKNLLAAPAYVVHSRQIILLSKAKRKSLQMTAVVSICFAVCWLPFCVAILLLTFKVEIPSKLIKVES